MTANGHAEGTDTKLYLVKNPRKTTVTQILANKIIIQRNLPIKNFFERKTAYKSLVYNLPQFFEQINMTVIYDGVVWQKPVKLFKNYAPESAFEIFV